MRGIDVVGGGVDRRHRLVIEVETAAVMRRGMMAQRPN